MADDAMRDISVGIPLETRAGNRPNFEKVSWGAIWAGVMVTIGMELLFLTFGIFIEGLIGGSSLWTLIWYLVTMGVSFYAGAWTATRLSDVSEKNICIMHGLATWGLATLSTVLLVGLAVYGGVMAFLSRFTGAVHPPTTHVWGYVTMYGGILWGGIMLSLITAYLGSASAFPSAPAAERREIPNAPLRRAS